MFNRTEGRTPLFLTMSSNILTVRCEHNSICDISHPPQTNWDGKCGKNKVSTLTLIYGNLSRPPKVSFRALQTFSSSVITNYPFWDQNTIQRCPFCWTRYRFSARIWGQGHCLHSRQLVCPQPSQGHFSKHCWPNTSRLVRHQALNNAQNRKHMMFLCAESGREIRIQAMVFGMIEADAYLEIGLCEFVTCALKHVVHFLYRIIET